MHLEIEASKMAISGNGEKLNNGYHYDIGLLIQSYLLSL